MSRRPRAFRAESAETVVTVTESIRDFGTKHARRREKVVDDRFPRASDIVPRALAESLETG